MNTKEKLIQLLELCIEKGLDYSYSKLNVVQVSLKKEDENDWRFYEYVGFYEFWSEEKQQNNLNDLITKVKNYQQ